MGVKLKKAYIAKDISKGKLKVTYDTASKKLPAWIEITGLPKKISLIKLRFNGELMYYRIYLHLDKIPIFIPVDYTKEEMKRFYDKDSESYDLDIGVRNRKATEFLLRKIKLPKQSNVLDIGAGTGLSSIPFAKAGHDVTLVDYSQGMLNKAKLRKELKYCKFVRQDTRKLKLNKKYDLIISMFSFASNSYYKEAEMPRLWKQIRSHLKPNGQIAIMGYDFDPPKTLFQVLKSGKYNIYKKYISKWFIGEKK